jgi:hypothetical protein
MIHVTAHAISRHMERCGSATHAEAETALRSSAVLAAAAFGAPYVKLPSGHRIVLMGRSVVTVLPIGSPAWRCGMRKDGE